MKIIDMQVSQRVSTDLILGECSIRKTKTNKDYLQLTLSDGTNTLDGKIWDYDARQGIPEAKKVYTVQGTIGEYQGRKQITVERMSLSADQSMQRFSIIYMPDVGWLWNEVMRLIDTITDQDLHFIVRGFYMEFANALMTATSAKGMHHVGCGGNLQHSYEVALYADKIASALNNELMYEQYNVNRDLCVAGALMHDVGKAWTYDQSTPAIDYNMNGRWFDHIIMGLHMLNTWAQRQPSGTISPMKLYLLQHIITSHHGEPEKGSPVYPNFMEAMIVNAADGLSASLNGVLALNRKAELEHKNVTDKNWTMGNHPMTLQSEVSGIIDTQQLKSESQV